MTVYGTPNPFSVPDSYATDAEVASATANQATDAELAASAATLAPIVHSHTFAVGGDLTGNLPNPSIAPVSVDNSHIDPAANIAMSKIEQPEAIHTVGGAGDPAYSNSWVAFSAGNPVIYWRDRNVVFIEGAVKNATNNGNAVIFTLPVGWRPHQNVYGFGHTTNSVNVPITTSLQVGTNGAVLFLGPTAQAINFGIIRVFFRAA